MTEQHRDSPQGHARKKQLNRKGVPQTMRMAFRNSCEREEALQTPLPLANRTVKRSGSCPEVIPFRRPRCSLEHGRHEIGQDAIDWHAGLLRVEKQTFVIDAIGSALNRISDSHAAVPEQENECSESLSIRSASRFAVGIEGRKDANHFLTGKRYRRPRRNLRSAPLSWRTPKRVLVNSMSDLFHEAIPDDYIVKVAGVMMEAHWHTFQVLTKRSDRVRELLKTRLRFAADRRTSRWGVSVNRAAPGGVGNLEPGRYPLGHRGRRERIRGQNNEAGVGPIFAEVGSSGPRGMRLD